MSVAARPTTYRRIAHLEWPSIALCLGIYVAFIALTLVGDTLPTPVLIAVGALLVAWHSSLQHEFIHGHPTPWRQLNRALATVPLSFWLPFESYRRSHLVHHIDEQLTDPLDDPESYYWTADAWNGLGALGRFLVLAHTTLAGRLVLGPAWNISRFLRSEWKAVRGGDRQRRMIWARHLTAVAGLSLWLFVVCRIDPLVYALIVYAATSLLLLRSFAEHRASQGVFERTAIVENSWFFGPLFLFNNLHAAHHERPLLPWYELPAWYRANRARLITDNGGLVYDGYWDVVRRFLFTPHDVVVHPTAWASGLSVSGAGAGAGCPPGPGRSADPS